MKNRYNKRYVLYNFSLDELEKEIELNIPVLVTNDPHDITAQVGGCESDDEHWCVEEFIVDEYDEFIDDSDFDSATHFYQLHEEV